MSKLSHQPMNYPYSDSVTPEPCMSEDAAFYRVYRSSKHPNASGIWVADFADEAQAVEYTKTHGD